MMSYTQHKGSLKPGHKAYNRKPSKGIRRGNRREKERRRQKAFEDLMAEQRRKNFAVDEEVRRKARAHAKQMEGVIPDDEVGKVIRSGFGRLLPRIDDRCSMSLFWSIENMWRAKYGSSFGFQCPETLGQLYTRITEGLRLSRDPLWKWILEISEDEYLYLRSDPNVVLAAKEWNTLSEAAKISLGITISPFQAIKLRTLGDFHRELKVEFDRVQKEFNTSIIGRWIKEELRRQFGLDCSLLDRLDSSDYLYLFRKFEEMYRISLFHHVSTWFTVFQVYRFMTAAIEARVARSHALV